MHPETLNERYQEARKNLMLTMKELLEAETQLKKTRCIVERLATEEAGGEKGLGSNESERKRNLEYAVITNSRYTDVSLRVLEAEQNKLDAEAELDCIKFEMRLYEASLKDEENKAIVHFGTH
jgi:uncharacterized protein (DUF3084 family)